MSDREDLLDIQTIRHKKALYNRAFIVFKRTTEFLLKD